MALSRWQRSDTAVLDRILYLALAVATAGVLILGVAVPVLAAQFNEHKLGGSHGTTHGHWGTSDLSNTHCSTIHSGGSVKHVSCDNKATGVVLCSPNNSSQITHLDCDSWTAWVNVKSHHWGPHISNHVML